jgi:hypothetical protein
LVVEERVAGEIHDFVSATNHAEVSRQQVELYRRSKQRQRVSEDGEQDFEIKPVPPVPSAPIELESAIEPTYGVPTTAPRPGLAAVQAESEAALAGLATSQPAAEPTASAPRTAFNRRPPRTANRAGLEPPMSRSIASSWRSTSRRCGRWKILPAAKSRVIR